MVAIPADIQAADAAGRIPSGISLEYLAETYDKSVIVGIIVLVAVSFVVLILRCFARVVLLKRTGIDDLLMVLAMVIYIPIATLCIVLINLGSGRHMEYIQYVLPMDTVRRTEVLDFVCHILYANALLAARFSGLSFYHRVAAPSSKLYYAINVAFIFLVACYLPQIFLLIFHCIPVTGLWPYEWQGEYSSYRCLSWGLVYSVISALSLACDFVMFTIPTIMIKGLRISLRKKLQLSLVLFPGVLVVAISTARLYLVVVGQWSDDGSWAYNAMLAVENAEIAGTLIALSVPALKPLFVKLFSRLAFLKSLNWNRSSPTPGPKSNLDLVDNYHKSTPNASRSLLDTRGALD